MIQYQKMSTEGEPAPYRFLGEAIADGAAAQVAWAIFLVAVTGTGLIIMDTLPAL